MTEIDITNSVMELTVLRMKQEILHDITTKQVSNKVTCFSDLHDYVDANEYGGFCDDEINAAMGAYFGSQEAFLGFINDAQTTIDLWIKSGALLKV